MAGRRRSRSGSPRRSRGGRFQWQYDSLASIATLTQNGQAVTELLAVPALDVKYGSTVVRQIGHWYMKPATSDQNVRGMMAIYMTKRDAFAAGAVPELELDEWNYLYLDQASSRIGSTAEGTEIWKTIDFDSKSKRKFKSRDDTLVIQLENVSDTAVSIDMLWSVRTLLYVP